MAVFKALADENRVRILAALAGGELCACQIVELLGLAPSTVSKHVAILKQARLVDSRKQGRWVYCRQAEEDTTPAAREASALVARLLSCEPKTREDLQRLNEIRKMDPEELCRRHGRC
jgi:DNA-binding transcriptional ArsR family regulator